MDNNIRHRQKLFEDYEESLFRLAVFDASEREGALAETEDPESLREQPTERQLARFMKTVRRHKASNAPRPGRKMRIVHRGAVSVAALLVIFLISVFTVDAFRLGVLNFLLRIGSEYTSVRLEDADPADGWDGRMPAYVPEGYEVQSTASNDMYRRIVYTMPSDGKKLIVFTEYVYDNDVNVDTENAEYIGIVSVNGSEATLTIKDGLTNIVWSAGDRFYYMYGTITTDEIVRMAESVES
jgi:hypothetical protein